MTTLFSFVLALAWPCRAASTRVGLEPAATPPSVEVRVNLTPTVPTAALTTTPTSLELPEPLAATEVSAPAAEVVPNQLQIPAQSPASAAASANTEPAQSPQAAAESGSAQAQVTFDGNRLANPSVAGPTSVAGNTVSDSPRLAQPTPPEKPAPASVPAPAPARMTWRATAVRLWRRLGFFLWPPVIEPQFNDAAAGYYHGTSFEALKAVVDSGGEMKPLISYFADGAGYPYGYARSSARKTGTPGVLLQFKTSALDGKLAAGHYQPGVPADRGVPVSASLGRFFVATHGVPLSAMSEESKHTLLDWMALQRDQNPQDASWPALIAKFEKALAPAPDLDRLEYGQARAAVGLILKAHAPSSSYFLGVGRSPAILTAILQNLDPRLAGTLPLSDFYHHPEDREKYFPALSTGQESALFDHFEKFMPADVLQGNRKLVLLDFVKGGRSMIALDEYLKRFAARRHPRLRWAFAGLAYDEPHTGFTDAGRSYPLITPADIGAGRRSILHMRMSYSMNKHLAEYDSFPAPFTNTPVPQPEYAVWRAQIARRMSRDIPPWPRCGP